jgi:hypothetical protein
MIRNLTAKRTILSGWYQDFDALTKIGIILTSSLFTITFLVWSYALLAYPLLGTEPCSTDSIFGCSGNINTGAVYLTSQLLGAAIPFLIATIILWEVSKSDFSFGVNTILTIVLIVGGIATYVPFFAISAIILFLTGIYAAPWPLLVLIPVALKARRIIKIYRKDEQENPPTKPENNQSLWEVNYD